MATIIRIQHLTAEKEAEYKAGKYYDFNVMMAFEKGIFGLEEFSRQAITKVCEQYADAPDPENDPLSFLHESRETTIACCEEMIRIRLIELMPEIGYSLFPVSFHDLDRKYTEMGDQIYIA